MSVFFSTTKITNGHEKETDRERHGASRPFVMQGTEFPQQPVGGTNFEAVPLHQRFNRG